MATISVDLVEDGPYRIAGDFQLLDSRRNPVETRGTVELCRCGESRSKPICDGAGCASHFETPDEIRQESRREYTGDSISVSFDASLCIHAAACLINAPDVFNVRKRPWIKLEGADVERVARVVARCPSGALQYRRPGGDGNEEPEQPATIRVTSNGPYYLQGDVRVRTPQGKEFRGTNRMVLCRCGSSRNKPFCDNSHRMVDFKAP